MPSLHDESHSSSSGTGANPPRRVHTHPHRLSLRASGWQEPIGRTDSIDLARCKERRDRKLLTWDCIFMEELRLSKAAALLLVQGMPLSRLFPPDLTFCEGDTAHPWLSFKAPIVLLKRDIGSCTEAPPRLRNVWLGIVIGSEGFSEDEIRSVMLEAILSP